MNILITGAGSGLGLAAAQYLAERGSLVYACDLKPPAPAPNLIPLLMDVTREDQILAVYEKIRQDGVRLDALLNVAGIFRMENFLEIPEETLTQVLDVNLLGAVRVNKILFPLLNPGSPILITTSEVAPLDPLPFNPVYSVSKTALDSYAQALRQEAGLLGHPVVTIRPGAFATPLEKSSLPAMRAMTAHSRYFGGQAERFGQLMQLFTGKPADPVRYARLVAKILKKKRPAAVYTIHANPGLRLLSLLPKNAQVGLVRLLLRK